MSVTKPTWTTDIQRLLTQLCWIYPLPRAAIDLKQPASVRLHWATLYQHLACQPVSAFACDGPWPRHNSLEIFRRWVNQGWRLDPHSPFHIAERIAPFPACHRAHGAEGSTPFSGRTFTRVSVTAPVDSPLAVGDFQ